LSRSSFRVSIYRNEKLDILKLVYEHKMATKSKIEWTDSTWNPVTGCVKISTGCKNCYAERMAKRLQAMGQENYKNGFEPTIHRHVLEYPLQWKKPQNIFVNSMSDLFLDSIPLKFIKDVFSVMNRADWHRFQVLTKRSDRLLELNKELEWTKNIWMGVSVENHRFRYRIDHLRKTSAVIKFLSIEPLIGPVGSLNLNGIDWVIVGGESGPGARLMEEAWVLNIRNQCNKKNVPFFFKQWGGVNKKKAGRVLEGRTWDEMPIAAYSF
jgi:protein gp37